MSDRPENPHAGNPHAGRTAALTLGALGVVFGDIGTSPLYTMHEVFGGPHAIAPTDDRIYGVLSLIVWSLILIVTVKYVLLIMRADNNGEGGIMALIAVIRRSAIRDRRVRYGLIILGIVGASLFYGDGVITPAISVLSAVEGLQVAAPGLDHLVVPLAVGVITAIFAILRFGTQIVGRVFGPVMLVWFTVLAVLGIAQIADEPAVLRSLSPTYAVSFFLHHGGLAFLALGSVVLAVTGAEALYADMGHFGRPAIARAWMLVAFPALVLNYMGQGALLLTTPSARDNPFYHLAPDVILVPLIVLATMATIIASQAVISGAFSLTRQAIQLGLLPRMTILHTSETAIGQIYVPRMNWLQMIGVITLVVTFGSSSDLAAAYGIAVTGAMTIDAILACAVAILIWRWHPVLAVAAFGALMIIDLAFFSATVLKIPDGAWFPLAMAAGTWYLISSWRRGRALLYEQLQGSSLPIEQFLERMERAPLRVTGTAVFMTGDVATVPLALLHNLKHNKVMHERVILMHVLTMDVPRVAETRRVEVRRLGKGFHTVVARYGFMEQPDVPGALSKCRVHGLAYDEMQTSFFLGRESLLPAARSTLGRARQALFIFLSTTALATKVFFRIPPNRAVELGGQVEV